MESHKLCILIATLIAFGYHSCLAINCTTTDPATPTDCGANVTECFTRTDVNGATTRGCLTNEIGTDSNVLKCNTDNCNQFLVCHQCDGSQPECGTGTAAGNSSYQLCTASTQQCIMRVSENSTVIRGCGEQCATDTCKSCGSDTCNVGVYPADRRECYQCSGSSCNSVDNATMLMPCKIYQAEGQQCYTIGTNASAMQRGCQTDDTDNKCSGQTPDPSCVFCSDQNGCNNLPFERVLGKCIKCSDSSTCVSEQNSTTAVDCAPANYTQTENSCFVQLASDGNVTRGCTNELSGICDGSTGCTTCSPNGCNNETAAMCLTCRSDNYPPCRDAAVHPEPCHNLGQKNECFVGEWDGVVIRGCLNDAGALMRFQCENDADTRCETCTGLGCNIQTKDGAGTLQHMGFGLLGLILVVRQFL